jgi:PEP-CTERM motif
MLYDRTRVCGSGAAVLLACAIVNCQARAVTVFSDNFSAGSTVPITTAPNNSYPATTATSTGYAIASSKNQSPAPSISAGHFVFGIGATTSGIEQAQALFTTSPVTLSNTSDFIELTITFVPTGIIATGTSSSGELDFGLFNSGHSAPHTDLSSSGLGSLTTDPNGGTQGWLGYSVRILPTTSSSKMDTRPAQSGTTQANQELLTAGASGTSSYSGAVQIGSATTANVMLTDGQVYTDDLVITLTGDSQASIVNNLYAGSTISGSPVSTFSKTASVANNNTFITGTFDGMAFGWRETGGGASSMDVSSITVSTNSTGSPPVMGDLDFDNAVTIGDVQTLMTALTDLTKYKSNHGIATDDALKLRADVDPNGTVDNKDVQALINKLANAGGGTLSAVPEPGSWLLLTFGAAGLGLAMRRRHNSGSC